MKKPIALISTDWHLKQSNCREIKQLIAEKCQIAHDNGLNEIFCLGDVFDSRVSQRMDVLLTFYDILDICGQHAISLVVIPGNHDKTNYESEESFLRPFTFHPSLELFETYFSMGMGDYLAHFLPYFSEKGMYLNYLSQVEMTGKDILFSHIAVKGSRNNDGTVIENELTPSKFKLFKKVFLGHYHNHQKIGQNIYHLPSLKQNNFGEDSKKGYTLIYDDLSFKIIKTSAKEYETVVIDVNSCNAAEINNLCNIHNTENKNVRLQLMGDPAKVKSIAVNKLREQGFFIQYKESQETIEAKINMTQELKRYNTDKILSMFRDFCNENKHDYKKGISYFQNIGDIENSLSNLDAYE